MNEDFVSVYFPIHCSDYLRSAKMTEVMMNTPSKDEIELNNRKNISISLPEPV
uniref:Uncharacterized protein n=1 Tax=Monodelphis domestica TaxID=13616 RepID=A0A5F8HEA0_MONDO